MCGLSGGALPQDQSAQLAQQAADARQAKVTAGQGNIDSAFGQFTPDYYNSFTKTYEDNYNPQVDDQFKLAQQGERYNLARKGMLDSTPAITAGDLLNKGYVSQRQGIASNALGATEDLKNNVAGAKSQLYALNESAADPSLAATSALGQAGALQTTPKYSPLGDLFGGLVNGTASYVNGVNSQVPPWYRNAFQPGSGVPSGSGSGKVIN